MLDEVKKIFFKVDREIFGMNNFDNLIMKV